MKFKAFLFFSMIIVVVGIMFSLQLWQASAQSLAPSASEKPSLTEPLFLKGKVIYEKQCLLCHGAAGGGDGKAAYLLYPKPRDFTRGEFRLISTSEMEATDQDLFNTISRGMPGSSMPSWDFLSEEERWALVYYIRYLEEAGEAISKGELSQTQVTEGLDWDRKAKLISFHGDLQSMGIPEEKPATSENIERGRQLFVKACASCHGAQGKGDGQMKMMDSSGYPLRPRDLTAGIFKGRFDYENLYYRIAAGLPGSPMPGYKDALTEEQISDLVHYIQTLPEEGAEERHRVRRHRIIATMINGKLELDPSAEQWSVQEPTDIALTPLWWRDERIESVEVRALHNGDELVIHLSWKDPTQDESMITPQSFSDGVAVQISTEKDPPFFAMGAKGTPVTIWHWKASWQEETKSWEDIETKYPHTATDFYESQTDYQHGTPFETSDSKAVSHDPLFMTGHGSGNPLSDPNRKSAVESAQAEGLGTLTPSHSELGDVEARGVYANGKWAVVFHRKLVSSQEAGMTFKPGEPFSIAFAVWDGSKEDRNGQKMVSVWNELTLES